MKIDKTQIVATALELLNELGLDALTTRKLAERLGVQQPTLYWHFKTRGDLLAAMAGEILNRGQLYLSPKPGDDWESFLTRYALSFRAALLAYRDGGRIHAAAGPQPADPARTEAQLRFLTAQGLATATALYLAIALSRYTLGAVLDEQAGPAPLADPGEDYPLAAEAAGLLAQGNPEATFRHGLRLLIGGADF